MDGQEAIALSAIEERLIAELGDELGPDEITHYLEAAVECFEEARVRTYVMLFIERRARADLLVAATSKLVPYEHAAT